MSIAERIQALKDGKTLKIMVECMGISSPNFYRREGNVIKFNVDKKWREDDKFWITSALFDESLPCEITEDLK